MKTATVNTSSTIFYLPKLMDWIIIIYEILVIVFSSIICLRAKIYIICFSICVNSIVYSIDFSHCNYMDNFSCYLILFLYYFISYILPHRKRNSEKSSLLAMVDFHRLSNDL